MKFISAWISTAAGIILIALSARSGVLAVVLAAFPGSLMVAGGVRSLMLVDYRAPQHVVLGSVLALLLAIPLGLLGGGGLGYAALVCAIVAFFAGGWTQIRLQPSFEEFSWPAPSLGYSARVALDDAVLPSMMAFAPQPTRAALREAIRESEEAFALFSERGWIEEPKLFHPAPPAIESIQLDPVNIRGFNCEHLRFESGYAPEVEIPGRDRWLSYRENRTSHSFILRGEQPGPWLVCLHGAAMGTAHRDFKAFQVAKIHRQRGVNVALFTLPVHGLRSPEGVNGIKFMGVSVIDFVHAQSQSMWDLRRLIGWIRAQEATQVGVYGISLGAYTSALLAGLEADLACVIVGVPPADMIHTREYFASPHQQRMFTAAGVDAKRDSGVHSVVSPLRFKPKVERDRRFIFAGTGDQFLPLEQVRALWHHWQQPHIRWCKGGHVSTLLQREYRMLVDEALARSFEIPARLHANTQEKITGKLD